MASSQTLKQRFIDLLFEDEYDVSNPEVQNKKPDSRLKASDILYKKPETKKEELASNPVKVEAPVKEKVIPNNTFINYQESKKSTETVNVAKKVETTINEEDEKYVAQPFLSPIFGNIEKDDKKEKESGTSNVSYACLEKPRSNYLGTVLSPIYGYDTINNKKDSKKETSKKVEIVATDVADNLTDIFASVEPKKDNFESEEKTSEVSLFDDLYKSN